MRVSSCKRASIKKKGIQFHKAILSQDDITNTQKQIQRRVLKYFYNRGFFDKDEMQKLLSYENSGFSLDASVKIQSFDKDALERLIRYCARPPFKSENIRFNGPWIHYRLPKPCHTGKIFIQIEPEEFIERISHFIPFVVGDLRANSVKQIYTAWQHAVDVVQVIDRRIRTT